MTRQHHVFCDIEPTERGHGQFCVSRPVAREATATGESGMNIDVTVDLVARWSELTGPAHGPRGTGAAEHHGPVRGAHGTRHCPHDSGRAAGGSRAGRGAGT